MTSILELQGLAERSSSDILSSSASFFGCAGGHPSSSISLWACA